MLFFHSLAQLPKCCIFQHELYIIYNKTLSISFARLSGLLALGCQAMRYCESCIHKCSWVSPTGMSLLVHILALGSIQIQAISSTSDDHDLRRVMFSLGWMSYYPCLVLYFAFSDVTRFSFFSLLYLFCIILLFTSLLFHQFLSIFNFANDIILVLHIINNIITNCIFYVYHKCLLLQPQTPSGSLHIQP